MRPEDSSSARYSRGVTDEDIAFVLERSPAPEVLPSFTSSLPNHLPTYLPGFTSSEVNQVKTNPQSKYPWSLWTDGKPHILVRGKHFQITTTVFQIQCHNVAKRRGLFVTTLVTEEGLIIQFCETKEEARNARDALLDGGPE